MGEVAVAYRTCREQIVALTSGLGDGELDLSVPACPGWAVRDVVAHVAGVVDDVLAGRLDGIATDPWTAAQVASGRGRALPELLDRWCSDAPRFESLLDVAGDRGRQAVADLATHEHDLRGALHRPGNRDSDAVAVGAAFLAVTCVELARERGISLRLDTEAGEAFGPPGAPAALRAPRFELLRALAGRRSEEQLRAMAWTGDVEGALPAFTFGPFRPASDAIAE